MDEGDMRLEAVNGIGSAVIYWFESRVVCSCCGTCRNRYRLAGARSDGVDTTLAIRALCDGTD
ncbi:40S ribosomal protein s9-1 [Phtheirospermum japonicum]|uniref:40S ribosomal protein s9-1 n=1 Tax=Phtheirospermum japonicum TaxID=374723 RepID=A0A830D5X7_9LAMI|nr:40S ribosomal protein s9-1 [Phtheirospermum japonicum]